MPIELLTYRGFELRVRPSGIGWHVVIRTPGSMLPATKDIYVRDIAGREVAIAEAQQAVDRLLQSN